jgi:pyridoxine 4-dehydrogenase
MTEEQEERVAAQSGSFRVGGDLEVNRLGFGAMRLTGEGIWGEPDDPAECRRVLERAVERGVNFIDTANAYGPEVSERLIAEALHPYPDDLVIATKAGLERSGPGRWHVNGRPEHLRAACEGSLRRLRLERIDLYQLHRIDRDVPAEDSLGALVELRGEGRSATSGCRRSRSSSSSRRARPRRSSRCRTASTSPTAAARKCSRRASARTSGSSPGSRSRRGAWRPRTVR